MTAQDTAEQISALIRDPYAVDLTNGTTVRVKALSTRSFFKLIKIITHGAGGLLANIITAEDADQVAAQILGMLIFAIPEAEDETMAFIQSLVELPDVPPSITDRRTGLPTDPVSLEAYTKRIEILQFLADPPPEDAVAIITRVVENEKDSLASLGKKIAAMLPKATPQTPSPAGTGPSTSSPESTDGVTSTSSTSPSNDSPTSSER